MSQCLLLWPRELRTEVGNDRVVTSKHTAPGLNFVCLAIANVGNSNALTRWKAAFMFYSRDRAVEPDPRQGAIHVEF